MFSPKDKKDAPKGKFPKPPAKGMGVVIAIDAKKPSKPSGRMGDKSGTGMGMGMMGGGKGDMMGGSPAAPKPDSQQKTPKQDAGYSQQQLCVNCKFYDAKDASCSKVDEYSEGEDPGFINPLGSCRFWEGENEQAEEEPKPEPEAAPEEDVDAAA